MKYVITGGSGHISGPVAEKLLLAGHQVTVIGRDAARLQLLKERGAVTAIGSLEDAKFLADSFSGSDAAYLMIPQNHVVDDFRDFQNRVAKNMVKALSLSGIKKAVVLSSVGAHMGKGAGPVDGLADLEHMITTDLPEVDALYLRPSFFYYNLFQQIGLIKQMQIMGSNYSTGNDKLVLTHTDDIADIAAEVLINLNFTGKSIRYIASDERSTDDIARILGEAIGKPGTPWVVFPDQQALEGMLQNGLKLSLAKDYIALGNAIGNGQMQSDYAANKPPLSSTKLEDFAKEFKRAFENA